MKLKNILSPKFKESIVLATIILVNSLLFSSQINFNYLTTLFSGLTGTISADKTAICKNDTVKIVFEAENGTEPYTFTYKLNDGSEETISTLNGQNSITYDAVFTTSGTFTYKLLQVEDSSGNLENLNQETTIIVTNPPTVDFNFTNDSTCSGETIQFTTSATGSGALSYIWNFGDGSTSEEENPTKVYNSIGNGSEVFSVSLIVKDENNCNTTVIKDIEVQSTPDIDFFSGTGSFINCSDGSSNLFNLELFNNSASASEITSYTIDWGDETPTETFSSFPTNGSGLMHGYPIGIFTLSITATNVNGCSNSITYDISNGSNPGGAFETPGSTVGICLPMDDPMGFYLTILDWGTNPINTSYSVDFGDGNVQNFTQQDLEDSEFYNESNPEASEGFRVYHSYTKGSCLEPNGEFIANLTITNDCGDTKFTVDSINILEPSEALFDLPSNIECINTPIEFENKTLIGDAVNCDKTARFKWDFGDGTFINTPFGSTADNQTHTYTAAGNYTVTLTVYGACGEDTYSEMICIEPEVIASYTLDTLEGCIPLNVKAQNTIDESELCSDPTYNWTVTFEDINCNSTSDWEFINSTDTNSENPQFLFKNPGNYTVTQNVTTNCGSFSTQRIISVKKPPTVIINPIEDFCQPGLINPTAIIENCTDNLAGVTYNWLFPGGSPSSSSLENPENIAYDNYGTYAITLEVTNDCGVSNIATQTFEVFEKPVLTNPITTQEICSNQSTIAVPLTSSNPNTTYTWTSTTVPNNTDITGFISSGSTSEIPRQTLINNGNIPGNVVYTVTPILDNCTGDPVDVLTVTVNPTPIIITQPVDTEVCIDGAANTLEVVTQNGVGTPTYQWYSNINNSTSGGNPISGATNSTYNPPTNTVGEIFYYVVISFDGGCADIESNVASVMVVQEPVASR